MEDEDDLRYALEMMCIDDPYSFDEANELYSVVAGIIGMKTPMKNEYTQS